MTHSLFPGLLAIPASSLLFSCSLNHKLQVSHGQRSFHASSSPRDVKPWGTAPMLCGLAFENGHKEALQLNGPTPSCPSRMCSFLGITRDSFPLCLCSLHFYPLKYFQPPKAHFNILFFQEAFLGKPIGIFFSFSEISQHCLTFSRAPIPITLFFTYCAYDLCTCFISTCLLSSLKAGATANSSLKLAISLAVVL